jgi:hypothetical protein
MSDPRRLVNCLEADPRENTARNNTCLVAIVGYHGNSVYRAVAWIPICVSVTAAAIGNLWEDPTEGCHIREWTGSLTYAVPLKIVGFSRTLMIRCVKIANIVSVRK